MKFMSFNKFFIYRTIYLYIKVTYAYFLYIQEDIEQYNDEIMNLLLGKPYKGILFNS
jgi:hypothetical protein